MVLNSFLRGLGEVFTAEIPGTALNVAEVTGIGVGIYALIWGARKLYQGVLGNNH